MITALMIDLTEKLLNWFDMYGRELPWRVKGGAHPSPYVILVSEFMLQQTTVKTVIPYFARFMARFPDVESLAATSLEDVLQYWQGLGYYTRAKSLHNTAQQIVKAGNFPCTHKEVMKLKGIGKYTAASYLSLAFNIPEPVVDGNVMRIICRMYHLTAPLDELQDEIYQKAAELTDKNRAADYASAIMDLGAMICTPKNPQCLLCPWQCACQSCGGDDVEQIPARKKTTKTLKTHPVYLIFNQKNEVYLRKRSEKGLLSGLYEFPWGDELKQPHKAVACEESVRHIFTHIDLTLQLFSCRDDDYQADGFFVSWDKVSDYPLSTLMKKVYNKYGKAKGLNK